MYITFRKKKHKYEFLTYGDGKDTSKGTDYGSAIADSSNDLDTDI